ncbi:hypothetical protein OHK33_03970 [Pectobacterium aroidearum]
MKRLTKTVLTFSAMFLPICGFAEQKRGTLRDVSLPQGSED